MPDQATLLRQQIRRQQAASAGTRAGGPKIIAVAGGKGGVGTTTVALNLTISLARQGLRAVLVDGDMHRADVAQLCQIEPLATIADVLAGNKTVYEAIYPGPSGIQILPGVWSANVLPDCSPPAQERLLRELKALQRHADVVVVDAGSGLTAVARRFWHAAAAILVVSTTDSVALMDAYAAIKVLHAGQASGTVLSVVNVASSAQVASGIHHRLAGACQRFLNLEIQAAGWIPHEETLPSANCSTRLQAITEQALLASGINPGAARSVAA